MRFPVLCGCAWAILAAQLSAELINGIEFPSGASSFADSLWRFDPEFSGGEAPRMWEPWNILGPPTPLVTQSIGEGGLIELRFDNNVLTTDGTSHPDLYVGEGAGTPEFVFVAIRPTPEALPHFNPQWDANQDGYFELGRFRGEVNREIFGSISI
jgi:hypothetical protein